MNFSNLTALLRHRNYAIYCAGNVISLTGSWIQRIAIAWLAWEMTQSPFWLGVVAASGLVPVLIVGPLGGVLADRLSQIRLIAVSQFLACVLATVLIIVYSAGLLSLGLLIAFRALLSAILAISQPTRMALIPSLVGPGQLTAAISFGAVVFNVARILGPALAGVLLAIGDYRIAFIANALTYLVFVVAILQIRMDAPPRINERRTGSIAGEIRIGVRYVLGHPGISIIFLFMLVAVTAARPISELLPAFVDVVYNMDVGGFALMTSSMAVGSILGGLWTTQRGLPGLTRTAITCGALYALSIAVFVLIPVYWLAVPVIALASLFTAVFGISSQTLIQSSVDDDVRGRVMSLWFVVQRAGPPLGALIMGALADWWGLSVPFLVGSGLCLITAGVAWSKRNALARALEVDRSKRRKDEADLKPARL